MDIEVQPQGRGEVLMAKDIGKRVSSLNGHKGRWEKAGHVSGRCTGTREAGSGKNIHKPDYVI